MGAPEWMNTYVEHGAWSAIEATLEQVSDLEGDDEQQQMLDHIRLTLKAVLEYRQAPTLLVSAQMLGALENAVRQNVLANLQQWVANPNTTYLSNAHTNLHTVLEAIRGWPSSKKQNLRSAAAVLRESVKASNEHMDDVREEMATIKDNLEESVDSFNKALEEHHDQADERFREVEASSKAVATQMEEIDTRLDTLIDQQQGRFDTSQQERISDFDDLMKGHRQELQKQLGRSKDQAQEALDQQREAATQLLDDMTEIKRKTADIASIVATSETSKAYHLEANNQRSAADWMRRGAIGLFIAAAIVTFGWIAIFDTDQATDQALLLRIGLSATLVGAAIYCVKESAKHRRAEFANRDLELKLRALDPFIQPIDPSKREEVMLRAANYFFGLNGEERPAKRSNSLFDRLHDDS